MNWKKVCALEEIPVQGARTLLLGDRELGIFRLSDGNVLAVENRCPHKEAPLVEGIVTGHHILCPFHNWKIDLTSGAVEAPDEGCVSTYTVKVEEGEVWVRE